MTEQDANTATPLQGTEDPGSALIHALFSHVPPGFVEVRLMPKTSGYAMNSKMNFPQNCSRR